jgi:hypothetical protein
MTVAAINDKKGTKGLTILGHELVQLHIVWVSPPFFPLVGVVGRDGWVADSASSCQDGSVRLGRTAV